MVLKLYMGTKFHENGQKLQKLQNWTPAKFNNFKVKLTQFCNFESALGKISIFKNRSSGIWCWRFSQHFLKVLGFFEALIFYKKVSYKTIVYCKGRYHSVTPVYQKELGLRFSSMWYHTWPGVGVLARKNRLVMNWYSFLGHIVFLMPLETI